MSKEEKGKRNRLADLLFLGGSLSAVAVLASYQLGTEPNTPPQIQPTPVAATPAPTPEATPEAPPQECVENHPEQPQRCITDRDPFRNDLNQPVIGGMVAPVRLESETPALPDSPH